MKEMAEKLQIVMNTIQDLDIKSTFDNMNHLLGVLQTLAGIRDELGQMAAEEVKEDDGEADAEG